MADAGMRNPGVGGFRPPFRGRGFPGRGGMIRGGPMGRGVVMMRGRPSPLNRGGMPPIMRGMRGMRGPPRRVPLGRFPPGHRPNEAGAIGGMRSLVPRSAPVNSRGPLVSRSLGTSPVASVVDGKTRPTTIRGRGITPRGRGFMPTGSPAALSTRGSPAGPLKRGGSPAQVAQMAKRGRIAPTVPENGFSARRPGYPPAYAARNPGYAPAQGYGADPGFNGNGAGYGPAAPHYEREYGNFATGYDEPAYEGEEEEYDDGYGGGTGYEEEYAAEEYEADPYNGNPPHLGGGGGAGMPYGRYARSNAGYGSPYGAYYG